MSNNAHIDKIFKEGIGEKEFSNVDAMWQKMELSLDNDTQKRKRRIVFFILFACLLTTGFFAANNFNKTTSVTRVAQNNTGSTTIDKGAAVNNDKVNNHSKQEAVDKGIRKSSDMPSVAETKSNKYSGAIVTKVVPVSRLEMLPAGIKKRELASIMFKTVSISSGKQSVIITSADNGNIDFTSSISEDLDNTRENLTDEEFGVEKNTMAVDLISMRHPKISPIIVIKPGINKAIINSKVVALKREVLNQKKISIELIGGGDILRMNRKAGYYAGVRVSRLLEKGTLVSAGLSYSRNTVNDRYRLLSKPADQRDADVHLSNIEMVRLPVYFQRQMANSKFALMVGLIPSYVIKATVYNVPNNFTGSNPDQYRKFAEYDLNRFNVLFGAGFKYAPLNRIAFELSGSYGFTSMVKNSYLNQSRVNDNFKSIQLGVVLKLK